MGGYIYIYIPCEPTECTSPWKWILKERKFRPGHGTPDPHPHRHPRFAGDRGWRSHPRFAGDRGSIRSPPGSQLERNRAFSSWRMIPASLMQVSDAHLHRRNGRRSASVARSSATPPRRASSSSSSDTADAGAADRDDGDYEPEERSAGNTPRRRSATCSTGRAISPATP